MAKSRKPSGKKPARRSGPSGRAPDPRPEVGPETGSVISDGSDDNSEASAPAFQAGPLPPFLQDDDTLLERSRVYWQTGEWEKLAALADENLESHPDRAKLSLLAAVGFAQSGDMSRARRHAGLAQDWGCDRELLARVLIGGVYNSLGRVASRQGDEPRAVGYFEASVATVSPRSDTRVLARSRNIHEKARAGMLPEATELFRDEMAALQAVSGASTGASTGLEKAMSRLDRLESMAGVSGDQGPVASGEIDDTLKQEIEVIIASASADKVDFYETVETAAALLLSVDRCYLYLGLAEKFQAQDNSTMALDCLEEVIRTLPEGQSALRTQVSQTYLELGQPWLAAQVMVSGQFSQQGDFSQKQQQALQTALKQGEGTKSEHGHLLLLEHLKASPPKALADGRQRVLVEVGTTRERVPGQGSTLKIADLCQDQGIHMITVDMDPRNSALARRGFRDLGLPFEAVTQRGEDFLARFDGVVDFVFLDAYDFDHGNHSDLRQSRYEAFLGSRIDEESCHRMHLECAEALVTRLAPDGLICIDDTWKDEAGKWTAKGTTAVPFLLQSGFAIVTAKNHAVLLRRTHVATVGNTTGDTAKDTATLPDSDEIVSFPDFELRIPTTDRSAAAYKNPGWYEEVTSPFYRHVREALDPALCLDIGANIGAVSMILKTCMPDVPLISAEPNPELHKYLRHNLEAWSGADQGGVGQSKAGWTLEKAIVGRKLSDEAFFHLNPGGSQDSRVIAVNAKWTRVETKAVTLAGLVARGGEDPRVYIKIDTQGFEQEILEGSKDYLLKSKNWLIRMEYAPEWIVSQGGDPEGLLKWLARHFWVAQFPGRYQFHDRPANLLRAGALDEADVPAFVEYCTGLSRKGRGWVDLLLCPRDGVVLGD